MPKSSSIASIVLSPWAQTGIPLFSKRQSFKVMAVCLLSCFLPRVIPKLHVPQSQGTGREEWPLHLAHCDQGRQDTEPQRVSQHHWGQILFYRICKICVRVYMWRSEKDAHLRRGLSQNQQLIDSASSLVSKPEIVSISPGLVSQSCDAGPSFLHGCQAFKLSSLRDYNERFADGAIS